MAFSWRKSCSCWCAAPARLVHLWCSAVTTRRDVEYAARAMNGELARGFERAAEAGCDLQPCASRCAMDECAQYRRAIPSASIAPCIAPRYIERRIGDIRLPKPLIYADAGALTAIEHALFPVQTRLMSSRAPCGRHVRPADAGLDCGARAARSWQSHLEIAGSEGRVREAAHLLTHPGTAGRTLTQ